MVYFVLYFVYFKQLRTDHLRICYYWFLACTVKWVYIRSDRYFLVSFNQSCCFALTYKEFCMPYFCMIACII